MKILVYKTAGPAPWFVWNKYGSKIIGLGLGIAPRYLLSIVWRKA